MTILAEGNSLKDGSSVLAKIAPAQSNGSMCLEREAHILGLMASSLEGQSTALRMIDFLKIPRESGDCVVLLLVHPGLNLLGRYLPPSKVNDLLVADASRSRTTNAGQGDIHMTGIEEPDLAEEMEAFDIMDLASFLEFAIQATRCLEVLHKAGLVHREVRANAFHLNSHSGLVRLVHFGNRAISLENFGSPSSLVLRAYEEAEKLKTKEALCYLAPEQTGSIETMAQDHRTDLYSLGILFWTLLVGRGQMPFEGGALELLHSIVQKRPMPVHEVRRDIPQVLANIIDKLLSKNPDDRYQSAYGLKTDLIQCQQRLLATVSSSSDDSSELIPPFEIAQEDRFVEFTMPLALYGREKELELIRNIIRNVSNSFSKHFSASKGYFALSTSGSHSLTSEDYPDSASSRSQSPYNTSMGSTSSPRTFATLDPSPYDPSSSVSLSPSLQSGEGLRKTMLRGRSRVSRTETVLVVGPPGIGKSSIILINQAPWRSHGLWGQAKFQGADSAPFAALLACLSSVLRQLMVFHTDLHRFVDALRERLGPQLQNVPLLYQGTPELKDVLALFDIHLDTPQEPLNTRELRARFQSLVENVFTIIAETRLFALFLDDLHEADQSTLDLVSTLVNSRSRMLIFATLRSDKMDAVEHIRGMFTSRSRATWITLEPLSLIAVSLLVSKTLHRTTEDCIPLSNFVLAASSGNAFSARSVLSTLQRQNLVNFNPPSISSRYDMAAIERTLADQKFSDPTDLTFLTTRLRELPEEARKYLLWAAFFGETFKVTEVALMMDWEDYNEHTGNDDDIDAMWSVHRAVSNLRESGQASGHRSMRGLQLALAEGWLITRARDMCSFAHDRYRQATQAVVETLSPDAVAKMSFRIILMMLHESPVDVYRIAEHAKRCLSLLRDHPKRDELLDVLIDAGESAWARGAHELSIQSFVSARSLLRENAWADKPHRTFNLLFRLAALYTWRGELDESDSILSECLLYCRQPDEKGNILRSRSRNHWLRGNYSDALNDTLLALKVLGIEINLSPTRRQADTMFEQVKNEILAVGFDEILMIPRTTDPRTELAVSLLNDAGMNAYWSPSPYSFADIIGLTTIKLALREASAERREMYRFSADLAKLALRIAERYGSSGEKCRAQVLFCSMVSGFDNIHIRANLPRLEQAVKYGNSAGDRIYTSFASIHSIITRFYVAEHRESLLITHLASLTLHCVNDIKLSTPGGEHLIQATAILNCIRVLGGFTRADSVDTVFDTESFVESKYLERIYETSGNLSLSLNCHRHIRYALFFHSLSLIACVRSGLVDREQHPTYLGQVKANQTYIRKWLSASPVNVSTWIALIDAELSSLLGSPEAFKLYDIAVRLAVNNDWLAEEGWCLYLQGSHFIRCGVEGLGSELQRRGISRHAQWGAQGIVNYLTSLPGTGYKYPLKRPLFSSDVAIQTDAVSLGVDSSSYHFDGKPDNQDDQESTLSAADLASILKWSKDISSDINLSSALQRLTEIATETSGSQNTCVVIAREAGDYTVATSMIPPGPCQVHENPKSIRTISDPLQKAIIQHTLNSKERVYYADATSDFRFSSEAGQTPHRSVICLPIFSNRGQTFGAVYFASRYAFSQNIVTILTLLCQQASISIANALLFRSVQAGTRENLKMISAQREALEAARKSREDALKATKIKSNFLASMSHELRTPFSSFYGLLDLLSGTELNPGQSEIVQTAKQSCELLLKIIDSILDYSKLEASAVKLEPSGFLVEDCMELLLPMAAKKLDLSFNIEPDVPSWVYADYARIRQVLMNLIGNAVKFTASGSVRVLCFIDSNTTPSTDEVNLKFEIHDTGIGLSASDVDLLFVPFQQADNSSTRRFGGTGLGLSISRQLVKLMGGAIGVTSEPDRGSMFWFTIPVKVYNAVESKKYLEDIEKTRSLLSSHHPLHVLVCSGSDATLRLLASMLTDFNLKAASSIEEAQHYLKEYSNFDVPLDFVILDDQSETHADDLARHLHSLGLKPFIDTKVIHLYTPTTSSSGHAIFAKSSIPGVVKMTKPPRLARLLQTLAGLKNLPHPMISNHVSEVTKAIENISNAQRTLYGNVLIAEDNPIAQNLLIKQLQRFNLNVVATSNGEEAITEWAAHPPGFFSVALFDHHMPICDGVEAAKRLRDLERKLNAPVMLPIVALSADCQDSTKQLCLSAGMNAFFSKPLKKNDLASLMSMFGSISTPG
ncbi:dual-domain HisK/Mak2 protein kinase [Gymnopilus junonius]|uniref:Dual-domain HisK/Mak2 protein kinase n=1 Tax=Gymnopilus junonius TaxID=109634 RepID=A0A9P5P267_GYMJU|nr:dual-domain HisK/Mak2 protein kinase [Gymnopilus junonius]